MSEGYSAINRIAILLTMRSVRTAVLRA